MGSEGSLNIFFTIFYQVIDLYKRILETTVTFGQNSEYQLKLGGFVFYGLLGYTAVWAFKNLISVDWDFLTDKWY